MANKRGRKNVYDSKIKPRFDEITKWLEQGATEKEIAKNLGVGYTGAFAKYKVEKQEFAELLKSGRKKPVEEIKAAMFRRATGFCYEEKKIIEQQIKFDDPDLGELPAKVLRIETTKKFALPDVAAGLVLLKHWDKDAGWTTDPQSLELKKKELELKEKSMENATW